MGCNNCKEKKKLKEKMVNTTKLVDNGIVWFTIIWSIFSVFGVYSFIKLITGLF